MLKYICKRTVKFVLTILAVTFLIFALFFFAPEDPADCILAKPVIYLYPEETAQVSVRLELAGELTAAYPAYGQGWSVTARPDGTLTDSTGREYYCLYWEGEAPVEFDLSRGFVVPGEETAIFLEQALAQLGLTAREANEFIIYWLPMMQENPYNLVSFQTRRYADAAALHIDPAPDTLIRVHMAWKGLDAPMDIAPQPLTAPERVGFTAVEWGGTRLS